MSNRRTPEHWVKSLKWLVGKKYMNIILGILFAQHCISMILDSAFKHFTIFGICILIMMLYELFVQAMIFLWNNMFHGKNKYSLRLIAFFFMMSICLNIKLLSEDKLITDPPHNIREAYVLSCNDGDTCTMNIDNLPDVFGSKIRVRIAHIDTPEMKSKCYYERCMAEKAHEVTQSLLSGKKAILSNIKRDKYFRLLADVSTITNEDVASVLLSKNLAVYYNGGKKHEWCSMKSTDENICNEV